jgi:hypothetical protein
MPAGHDGTPPGRPIDTLQANFSTTNAAQGEQIKALEELSASRGDDAASYRLLAKQAIHALHHEQVAHAKLRERYDRLVEEYREHRARTLTDVGAAA